MYVCTYVCTFFEEISSELLLLYTEIHTYTEGVGILHIVITIRGHWGGWISCVAFCWFQGWAASGLVLVYSVRRMIVM